MPGPFYLMVSPRIKGVAFATLVFGSYFPRIV